LKIEWIPVKYLKIASYNPREARDPEIIEAIKKTYKKRKLIKPLLVRKVSDTEYEVFDGGTRLEALQEVDPDGKAPCIVYDVPLKVAKVIAAIVHADREDLTDEEKGKMILKLIGDVWKSEKEAAEDLGRSERTIRLWKQAAKGSVVDLEPSLLGLRREEEKKIKLYLGGVPKPVRHAVAKELKELRKSGMLPSPPVIVEAVKNFVEDEEVSNLEEEEVREKLHEKIMTAEAKFLAEKPKKLEEILRLITRAIADGVLGCECGKNEIGWLCCRKPLFQE